MKRLRARDVMTRPAITVHPETTIPHVLQLMLDHRVSGLVVTDHLGRVVGMVTEADLATHVRAPPGGFDRPPEDEALRSPIGGDLMTRDVVTAEEDTPVRTLVSLMVRHDINRIPITTGRRVLGIVARADILRALARADGATRADQPIEVHHEAPHDQWEAATRTGPPRVLLVTDRRSVEEAVAGRLEGLGFDVLVCPGPRPPDYVCIAGAGGSCPLVGDTDAVVLDCDLGSDTVHQGTTSWDLLAHYRRAGLPVVALARADGDELPPEASDPSVIVLPKTTDPVSISGAVLLALERTRPPTPA